MPQVKDIMKQRGKVFGAIFTIGQGAAPMPAKFKMGPLLATRKSRPVELIGTPIRTDAASTTFGLSRSVKVVVASRRGRPSLSGKRRGWEERLP